jgi:similar to stage IV sporulation protein
MLFLRLWNYLRGYVIILVEGYFLEKFINICTHRQIYLWDIKRQKDCRMKLKLSIQGFRLIRPIARKTGCRVRIAGKRGLPFLMNRYRKRKTFLVGAVAFILLFFFLSSFVWDVEISGNQKMVTEVVSRQLASMGIKPGVWKYGINTDRVADDLVLGNEEIAWVGVILKGTRIRVTVKERVLPPEIIPVDVPCNIVANRDGLIKAVIAKEGQDLVKAGDTVTRGQVLISGRVVNKNDETKVRMVHAMGTVEARTWYEGTSPVVVKTIEQVRTGRKKDHYSLVVLDKRLPLFHGKIGFSNFEKIEIRKRLSLGEDMVFPFAFTIDSYYEIQDVENEMELEEAEQLAADYAYKLASEEVPEKAEIVNTNLDYAQLEDGSCEARVIIECLEDIGIMEEIGGN